MAKFEKEDDFYLTDTMKKWVEEELIPNFKDWYDVSTKEEMEEIYEEVDWADFLQDCTHYTGEWDVDEIIGINKNDFEDEHDYNVAREEKFFEHFEFNEHDLIQSLAHDYFEECDW